MINAFRRLMARRQWARHQRKAQLYRAMRRHPAGKAL